MKKLLLENLGVLILLIGVIVLALHYFAETPSNVYLAVGLGLIIVGIIVYLLINKHLK
jgi:membrane protein YdbS with pleckstrin-like domain